MKTYNLSKTLNLIKNLNPLTLNHLLKIYIAYKMGGWKTASLFTSSILCDEALISKFDSTKNSQNIHLSLNNNSSQDSSLFAKLKSYFNVSKIQETIFSNVSYTKHYLSLSLFWGIITHQANSKLKNVEPQHKILLQLFYLATCVGLIFKAKDIFSSDTDTKKIKNSVFLISKFFDKDKTIENLETNLKDSAYEGIKYSMLNIKPILSNKFILYTASEQAIHLTQTILLERVLFLNLMNKSTMLAKIKLPNGYEQVIKYLLVEATRKIIQSMGAKLQAQLDKSLQLEINSKTASICFDDSKTEIIMKYSESIKKLPDDISVIHNYAKSELANLITSLFLSLSNVKDNNGQDYKFELISNHSSLILLNGFINIIFNKDTLKDVKNKINSIFYKDIILQNENSEYQSTKMGGMNISTLSTPVSYGYQNIQEIAKLSANNFMLKRIVNYIKSDSQSANFNTDDREILYILLETIQKIVSTSIFLKQAQILNINNDEIDNIENKVVLFLEHLKVINSDYNINSLNLSQSINNTLSTINILNNPLISNLKRDISQDLSLVVQNYKLCKAGSNNDMLQIEKLIFEPNKVYVISGKIGCGKTTFLTDIASCLAKAFESSGEIYYPTTKNKKIEKIFCGTIMFSPPKTSFFEKLTYKLEEAYIEANKSALEQQILNLFQEFNQTQFNSQNIHVKSVTEQIPLSTGQQKIFILISAIIYKQYLKEPVLFILDETLANLDTETTKLVSQKIKEVFEDSMIIAVDHQFEHNPLYQERINLADFQPEIDSNIMQGQLAGDLIDFSYL